MGEALTVPLEEAFMSRTAEGEVSAFFVLFYFLIQRAVVCYGEESVTGEL